jgi:Domain of unknown function (DUF4351)
VIEPCNALAEVNRERVKLIDYRTRSSELESSNNPFATVVMAHLKTIETRPDLEGRKIWKLSLIRGLYERGLGRQDILNLYRFIDWLMILPEGVEEKFWQELKTFEEERKVTYVTTGERIGFNKGKQEGALGLALRLLARRIGPLEPEAEQKIRTLSLTQLEELGEALLDFTTIADLENWLSTQ